MNTRQLIVTVIAVISCILPVAAQRLNMGDELPVDSAVRIGKLHNGMTYYLRHNENPKGKADFYMVYHVGAIQEDDNQSGLAHFLEHMAFNGTKHFPGDKMVRWLESIGLQFGTNLNAATGMESTYYQLTQIPMARESVTDSMLLILHDWSGYLQLTDKEIDKERGVIIEERRQRNNAAFRIGRQSADAVYGGTRYAKRDMLGTEKFLQTFPSSLLRDYYKKWYRPDLQAVVIVGDFDVDKMEAKLKSVMADIPKPVNPSPKENIIIPTHAEPVVTVVSDPEQKSCQAYFYIQRPSVPSALNNRVGTMYMNTLINLGTMLFNVRLEQLRQQEGCPFTTAMLRNSALTETCDALELQVTARGMAIGEAFTSVYGELERIRRYGFTQEELDNVRTSLLRGGLQAYETSSTQNSTTLAQACIGRYLRNTPLMSAKMNWALLRLMLEKTTIQKLNELMAQLISLSNNTLVLAVPQTEKDKIPSAQLKGFFSWIRTQPIENYQVQKVDRPLFTETVIPGKVVKTETGKFGSTVWTLSNGIRVVLKHTGGTPNLVTMNGTVPGGLALISQEDYYTASLSAQVVMASGVNGLTPGQIRQLNANKVAQVMPVIGRFQSDLNGSAAKADVETMLQLTNLYFTHPMFDEGRFAEMIEANRMNLENSARSVPFVQVQSMNKLMYGDNPRTQMPTPELLKGISLERMPALYNRLFIDEAGNFTFYFVGDVDAGALRPLVEKYLGSLPAAKGKAVWKDDGVRVVSGVGNATVKTPMETPAGFVRLSYTGSISFNPSNQMLFTLLADYLLAYYNRTIREEKGGTYGVTVTGTIERQPVSTYNLTMSLQTSPSMVDELSSDLEEGLQTVASTGISPKDFDQIITHRRQGLADTFKNDRAWLNVLQQYYNWGEDWYTGYDKLLDGVKPDDLQRLAQKILKDGNEKEVIIVPE